MTGLLGNAATVDVFGIMRLSKHTRKHTHTQTHTHANTHTHTTTDTHTHKSQDVSLRADSISRRFLEVDSVHEFVFGFQR